MIGKRTLICVFVFPVMAGLVPVRADDSVTPVSGSSSQPAAVDNMQSTTAASGDGRPIRRERTDARTTSVGANSGASGSWVRTTAALGGVVAIIIFLSWGYRSVTNGSRSLLGRQRRPGAIEILSRTSLSPRQSICLVRVGPRAVLVGIAGDGMRTLDVIEDAAVVAQLAGQSAGNAKAEFDRCLNTEQRAYDAPTTSARPTEELAQAAIRVLAAKQKNAAVGLSARSIAG